MARPIELADSLAASAAYWIGNQTARRRVARWPSRRTVAVDVALCLLGLSVIAWIWFTR